MSFKTLFSRIEAGDNAPMKTAVARKGVPMSLLAFLFMVATIALSACLKSPMGTAPQDGSADTPWPNDVVPPEPDTSADASATSQPDTSAFPDTSNASQPDPRQTPDARTLRPPGSGALADLGTHYQPETNVAVDAKADAGNLGRLEVGGGEAGGVVNEEVGSSGNAVLNLTPSSVTFGTVDLGKSVSGAVVVANVGTARSGILVVIPGTGLAVTGCSGVLLPETSCTLIFTATPTALGPFASSISITANPGTSSPLLILVTGAVVQSGQFSVTPTTIDLGTIVVGALAPLQTITIATQSALADLTVERSGTDVKIDAATTCTSTLAAGVTCAVVVNFSASSAGSKSDSIVISAGGKTVVVPITATVVNFAKLVISPSTATFATQVGVTSSSIIFGVANAGDIATGAITASITGANAADFTISANSCLMLAPLSGCSISVVFAPGSTSAATETATLIVQDGGAGASAVRAALSGSVYSSPALAITSDRSDLGAVPIGTTGTATVFTVTNSGDTTTGALAVSVSGPEFVIIGDTCTGVSLAKGASCTVSLALKPITLGAKAAILKVAGTSGAAAVKSVTGSGIS